MKELRCPNCDGPLIANDSFTLFTCKACGVSFADLERGDDERERKDNIKLERQRMKMEQEKIENRNMTIMVCAIIAMIALSFLFLCIFA